MLEYLPFGLVFFGAAYYDVHIKKVPDLLAALLWLVFAISGFPPISYQLAALAFGVLYFMNVFKQAWGWGDILLAGPAAGVMFTLPSGIFLGIFAVLSCELVFLHFKKENERLKMPVVRMPLYPFVFFFFLVGILLKIVLPTV